MKKFTKIIAFCLLIAIVSMTFASCGLFGMNFMLQEKKLESKGYTVIRFDYKENGDANIDSEETAGAALVMLGAIFSNVDGKDFPTDKSPESVLVAFTDDDSALSGEYFVAMKFEKFSEAKEFYQDLKENWTGGEGGTTYGKKGNVVYVGTVQGVKDALGFPANILVN